MMILIGTITLAIVMRGELRGTSKVSMSQRMNMQAEIDFAAGRVHLKGANMHPNHQLLLDAVAYLQPTTVHEVGCGGGDHVANITRLFPECYVSGGDRGLTQLEMAINRHPEIQGKLGLLGQTMPYSSHWPKVDLVSSQIWP